MDGSIVHSDNQGNVTEFPVSLFSDSPILTEAPVVVTIENSPEMDEQPLKGCCKRLRKSKDPLPEKRAKELRDELCAYFKQPGACSEIRMMSKYPLAIIYKEIQAVHAKKTEALAAKKNGQPARKKQKKQAGSDNVLGNAAKAMESTSACLATISAISASLIH
jgi:hypothetical protein